MLRTIGLCIFVAAPGFSLTQQVAVDYNHKFDEFNGANWENAMSRLDNFALEMGNDSNEIGVVIVYGGSHGRRGEAKAWSACVKEYLTNRRGIPASRLIMMDGGYRRSLTVELWGTADRKYVPNPTAQIEIKNVRFSKGKIGHWRKMCAS
jgi:hypothetical protein